MPQRKITAKSAAETTNADGIASLKRQAFVWEYLRNGLGFLRGPTFSM
jgi:hypothetical protein